MQWINRSNIANKPSNNKPENCVEGIRENHALSKVMNYGLGVERNAMERRGGV
jgi:hypothetical protein